MFIVLGGTIKPSKGVKCLALSNEEERLKQYLDSVSFFIYGTAIKKVVFCENSNSPSKEFITLQIEAQKLGKQFEFLSFQGDDDMVTKRGKGYGEGQIIEYVLMNSRIAQEEDYFVKLTGRLKLDNADKIFSKVKQNKGYINKSIISGKEVTDTRLYAMPIRWFKDYFMQAYKLVDDKHDYYLEHVYADIIRKNKLVFQNFPVYPRITGIAGSSGQVYSFSRWKCIIKDALSVFQFYKMR